MKKIAFYKKPFAAFLLLVMSLELLLPAVSYGLTSGPSQPEMKGFEPIGNTDMVDLFSGDFSYNIPLMDVGGYPVNLSYHSGSGADDEASWTGLGWNLNVGSMNRQLRGLADDFNGVDQQEREMTMKDHITKGGRFSMTLDLIGIPVTKAKHKRKKKKLSMSLTVSAGVKFDNYRGVGMELGANAGGSLTDYVAGEFTQSKEDSTTGGLGLPSVGLNLSSMDGAGVSLNMAILKKGFSQDDKNYSFSKSIGFGYNSRAGLTHMTLGGAFNSSKAYRDDNGAEKLKNRYGLLSNSSISFNGNTYTPTIDHPTKNNSYTFSLHLGPELWVIYPGFGLTGFYSKQEIKDNFKSSPAFGYLHSEKGKDNNDALMDFNREKDIPYSNQVKYLPVPVPTYDLFSASSQDGGGQYRLYRGSSGVLFDQRVGNANNDFSLGIEVGAGTYFDVGADLYFQHIETVTQKWKSRNNFLGKGDYLDKAGSSPLYEPAYFKRVGEPVPNDKNFVSKIKGTDPVAVQLPSQISNAVAGAEASDKLRTKTAPNGENTALLKRDKREVRNTTFSYLTASEATHHGLDKTIRDYHPDSLVLNSCNPTGIKNSFQRVGDYRKAHHFSEITITGDDGKRSVYGIPVYNTYQEEVSFSIGENLAVRNKGLINYQEGVDNSISNKKGRENYYSKEKTPPYATSYLLTGMLSPDYVDKTGDGITDDDLGTAVKFNYTRLNNLYNWRTPFALGKDTANYNEGFLSDAQDDKANYVYGQKEIWYLHSIESKTMVAHFILGDRQDGLGVINSRGEVNTANRLKYLKEIRLYSKSDLRLHSNNPALTVPIKVAHLEYDHAVCKGLPNSIGNAGKLTLKKVFFTFGLNQKGRLHPYEFSYDTSYNQYTYRQYDRWGNLKDAGNNPNGLNNGEYPYTLQDTALTNKFIRAGQLNKIMLPTGGNIQVKYESDDYAWVQDRRASQMCFIQGVGTQGASTGLINADYIYVTLPKTVSSRNEMLERYFEGIETLYYKTLLNLDAKGHEEFVPGYARIVGKPELIGNNIARVQLEKSGGVNPIAKSGWQFLRVSLPKYAYPGSDNLEDDGSDLKKTLQALVAAFGSIKDLIYGFDRRARDRRFSDQLNLSKSWVRLCAPEWKKLGGGIRVQRVDISDDWESMSETAGARTTSYSQVYDYTTTDTKGRTISSGVASYEPLAGNDENPFRQPVRYKQNQFLGLDNYYYIEEPFGESFFPAAQVGYSKVTVKSIGSGDGETVNRTGVVVNEYYTAKDYPTKVDILGLQQRNPVSSKLFKLIGGISYEMIGLSQGYSIELNDMHGKPKSTNIFNKSGEKISGVEYSYQSDNELAEKKTLRNDVKVIAKNGTVSEGTIGMDVEMFTDMRQQTTDNLGISVKVSGGSGAILWFPLPFFFPGIGVNYDKRSYRAASTVKIVQRFAIQHKVKKIESGSSITSENLLWDAETGNVLLTKTQNEFDDPVYSFAYPAHWVYNGMGQAYENLGTILTNLSTNANGEIINATYNALLVPGDELIDIHTANKYWVIHSPINNLYRNRLVDAGGNLQSIATGQTLKILRSGKRNMAGAGIGTIVSLHNPIEGDRLNISQLSKVLDAKASVFNEEWSVPLPACATCPPGYTPTEDAQQCYKDTVPISPAGYSVCAGSPNALYSYCGTYEYHCNGGTLVRSRVGASISFWNQAPFGYDATLTGAQNYGFSCAAPRPLRTSNQQGLSDTLPGNKMLAAKASSTLTGPLNRTGIWACGPDGGDRQPVNVWLGFEKNLQVPTAKTYYLGLGCDNEFRVIVDGAVRFSSKGNSDPENFKLWHIFPLYLDAGSHSIKFEAKNTEGNASFGAELYNNTLAQLNAATGYSSIDTLFSTANMIGQNFSSGEVTCPPGYTKMTINGNEVCRKFAPLQQQFNPYYSGVLGNWRPQSQFAYQVNRENLQGDPNLLGGTQIRKSGAYSLFNPFWQFDYAGGNQQWNQNPANDKRWIAANSVTYFNAKGLEIENKDALDRYSSALFGYLESLPVAVASNARYREIAYDGMEDYGFTLDCIQNNCSESHFSFSKLINGSNISLNTNYAHSGKYSLQLNGNASIIKEIYTVTPQPIYNFENGKFVTGSNELAKGFSPIPGKQYVLSYWIKDSNPRSPSTNMQASVNGNNLINSASKWPVVEGWKRIEVTFVMPPSAASFVLELQSGGGILYLDDIRIHPFDGQLKSFTYDPSSQRLMAELDENNFATFYEYDDEGVLIRVKKETERGIMTIKETRSAYRKR